MQVTLSQTLTIYQAVSVPSHDTHLITISSLLITSTHQLVTLPWSLHSSHYQIFRSTVHYPEQFPDPVCSYLCILTFKTSMILLRFSNEVLHPTMIKSHQYSAKTLWAISITKILPCHLLLSTWSPFLSINHPVILLTCCVLPCLWQ